MMYIFPWPGILAAEVSFVLSYHPMTNWYIMNRSMYEGFWQCPGCTTHYSMFIEKAMINGCGKCVRNYNV